MQNKSTVYKVVKAFTDHRGEPHTVGELAERHHGATYGVLGDNEVPLIFEGVPVFIGVDREYLELVSGEDV